MNAARLEGWDEPVFSEKSFHSVVAKLLKKLNCKMQSEKSSLWWTNERRTSEWINKHSFVLHSFDLFYLGEHMGTEHILQGLVGSPTTFQNTNLG